MSLKLPLPQGFSFLKSVGWFEDRKADSAARQHLSPTLKLQTDKEVYRPGDSVTVTIEISSPATLKDDARQTVSGEDEARVPLQIRVSQKSSTLLSEEGTLPLSVDQLAIFWREKDEDSEWTKANDNTDLEEGYDSSKDEVSSVSSYNPSKANPEFSLRNSLSMQSLSSRLSTSEPLYNQAEPPNFPSYSPIPRLSVSEISDDPDGGLVSPQRKLNRLLSDPPLNGQKFSPDSDHPKDDVGLPLTPKHAEPAGSEGFARGRSYNIRIDDQVLLRFSPKNSDSTYYFGDMIGGALTFFHGTGTRRCLEVSITLETSETINPRALHPSRRSSPTITKVKNY
ncbi:hypothetical protein PR202_gb13988 [Eleusine coracana subsp. coracana]|uniref:Uncharacterized protein n=1 Tax=Eleusine coracana subsp. coracana TaxID=191504 RepID=A0AAV5EV46_ELECO|nr:hypothetical protein PR202_gb13988 [Eleusine coracana subsp. coracana]